MVAPFSRERHAAFQTLLARYGDPQLVDTKRRIVESVAAGYGPSDAGRPPTVSPVPPSVWHCGSCRQLSQDSPALTAWLSAHDRLDPEEPNDATGEHPCTA